MIWSAARSSASTSSGTYRRTGASSATFPSATRRITAVAVNVLVTEPIRNSVCCVTGSGFSTLVTPWLAKTSRPSAHTPTAAPVTPSPSAVSFTNPASASSGMTIPFPGTDLHIVQVHTLDTT